MSKPIEIELHPGHWSNPGSGANGLLNEVTEARKVTKRVYEILKAYKVPCTYFEDNTSTNQRDNINTLVKHHNADSNGLVVSIHFNASGGLQSKGIGTEVLYYDQKSLAEKIAKAISSVSGLINRGTKKRTDLGVLASTYEPAVLIEVCFVNSTVDAAIYRRDFGKICQAIAKELADYIGKCIENKEASLVEKSNKKDYEGHWAEKSIGKAIEKGVMKGYPDGNFGPDDKLTRAQFTVVMDNLKLLDK